MTVLDPSTDPVLRGVFTAATAHRAGVTRRMLDGRRYRRVVRGVWRMATTPMTPELTVTATLLATSADAALSHTTALSWLLDDGRLPSPVHVSVHGRAQTRLDDVVLHRRRHPSHRRRCEASPASALSARSWTARRCWDSAGSSAPVTHWSGPV